MRAASGVSHLCQGVLHLCVNSSTRSFSRCLLWSWIFPVTSTSWRRMNKSAGSRARVGAGRGQSASALYTSKSLPTWAILAACVSSTPPCCTPSVVSQPCECLPCRQVPDPLVLPCCLSLLYYTLIIINDFGKLLSSRLTFPLSLDL